MSKTPNSSLPAYTTVENIILLIDTLKRKNNNEDEVKALFGKASSAYTNTKSALRTFGFIDADSLNFTKEGREAAYSQGNDKKSEMIKVLKSYPPYEVLLYSLLQKEDVSATEIEDITNFWGKASYGSTQRNREDAAKLFMSIVDYCEYGKYVIGRGSNATRIEWSTDIKEKIESLGVEHDPSDIPVPESSTFSQMENAFGETTVTASSSKDVPQTESVNVKSSSNFEQSVRTANMPNIVINVDMGDWPDEKIKTFFMYAYGKFEEE